MASSINLGDGHSVKPIPDAAHASAPGVTLTAPRAQVAKVAAITPPPWESTIKFDPIEASKNLKSAIAMLNEQMASSGRGLGFSYDDSVNSPVIKVNNTKTGELVRQIPSEDVLRIAHKLDQLKGVLFDHLS